MTPVTLHSEKVSRWRKSRNESGEKSEQGTPHDTQTAGDLFGMFEDVLYCRLHFELMTSYCPPGEMECCPPAMHSPTGAHLGRADLSNTDYNVLRNIMMIGDCTLYPSRPLPPRPRPPPRDGVRPRPPSWLPGAPGPLALRPPA